MANNSDRAMLAGSSGESMALPAETARNLARHDAIRQLAREDVEAGTYDLVILPEGAKDE